MKVETLLLAKHKDQFDRIMKLFRSLIVFNTQEADAVETEDMTVAYDTYEQAFLAQDSTSDYIITYDILLNAGFGRNEAIMYASDLKRIDRDAARGDEKCKAFLMSLRRKRLSEYVEANPYYRQFQGIPFSEDEFISVKNNDNDDPLYLHQVTLSEYPNTYSRLYYKREVQAVYDTFNYTYLKFLENKPFTPYEVRNKEQFDIMYYDAVDTLTASEFGYFFDAYAASKREILENDYIANITGQYKCYANVMFELILCYTFNSYCAKLLEKYSVQDYTDSEIYDILDSNNLSNLKTLPIDLLRRVVKNLNSLKTYTGTNKVYDIIFDIAADKSLSIKRYYLNKKHSVDADNHLTIDTDKMYVDNVKLVFTERTTHKSDDTVDYDAEAEYDYDDFTSSDDTWGGNVGIDDEALKERRRRELAAKILACDFASIKTKYLGLTKTIDAQASMVDANDKLGLLYQYFESIGNPMKDDMLTFDGIECNAMVIYACYNYTYGRFKQALDMSITDPDRIVADAATIDGLMRMRLRTGNINIDIDELGNAEIDLYGDGKWFRKVSDYIPLNELRNYMVHFTVNEGTTISELFEQYEENKDIITKIKHNIIASGDYAEYQLWRTIYNANMTAVNLNKMFGGYENYSEFIRSESPDMYRRLAALDDEADSVEKKNRLQNRFFVLFRDYLYAKSEKNTTIMNSEGDLSAGDDLTNLSVLLNQFMSALDQLYKEDYHLVYDDELNNAIELEFAESNRVFFSSGELFIELVEKLISDAMFFKREAAIELIYKYLSTTYVRDEFDIELDFEKIADFSYKLFNWYIDLFEETTSAELHSKSEYELGLEYEVVGDTNE